MTAKLQKIMNKELETALHRLQSRLSPKNSGVTYQDVCDLTKEKGINDGNGFAISTVYQMLNKRKFYNKDIADCCLELLELANDKKIAEADRINLHLDKMEKALAV